MGTTHLFTDAEAEANPEVKAVFDDIRATRGSDFVNNIWRALAADPKGLKRTWENVKSLMAVPGALDPKTRDDLYRRIRGQWMQLLRPLAYRRRKGQGHVRG